MKKSSVIITLGMSALGLATGYFLNSRISAGFAATGSAAVSKTPTGHSSKTIAPLKSVPVMPEIRSTETLQTLMEQGETPSYAQLASWLLDADPADIAAYWEFRKGGKIDGDKKRLIFFTWTRVDPKSAIAAVAGTDDAEISWWAWAANDPQAALSAVDPDRLKNVARGIGEFQPKWLRENFDLIPKEAREDAVGGLSTWKEESDHPASLDFLREHAFGFPREMFQTFARKDPFAAFEWLRKNDLLYSNDPGPVNVLLDTMKSSGSEYLDRLAALVPPGSLKRKIEDVIFERLLATDPEAAYAAAKATDAPLVAVNRLAAIGLPLIHSDPEKAFEIAQEILTLSPKRLTVENLIQTGKRGATWGSEEGRAKTFISFLFNVDPQRTLEMTVTGQETVSETFQNLAGQWAAQDLSTYTEWVNLQTDTPVKNAATNHVVNRLASQGHFYEAVDWALSVESENHSNLYGLASQWGRTNRDEATAWLESADLPDSTKNNLRNAINHNQ